ncbi:MAG: hypothetical protein ABIY55_18115 [Kofleriaceae bacterium]
MPRLPRSSLTIVLGLGWLVACGSQPAAPADATFDATMACNPVAQTGCALNEKCTWVVDLDATAMRSAVGHIGCAPDGTIADAGACNDAVASASNGIDNCLHGEVCVTGKCKPICDPQLLAGVGACATNDACSIYADIFNSAGTSVAGVCEPSCDPLTQALNAGAAPTAACGSPDPTQPAGACVASVGFRSFHCAPTSTPLYANLDRSAPFTDALGNAYSNGCAPGFIPFYFEDASGAMKTLCTGMCAPLKVDQTIAGQAGHQDDNRGDKAALGKLPTDGEPAMARATCDAGVKGSTVTAPHGQDCRFLWFPLAKGDPTRPLLSPFNDTLGVCFAYEKFVTVTVPGMAQKQAEKSCAELPAAPTSDPFGSAKDNGCYPLAESIGVRVAPHRASSFRLANGAGLAVRHVFD